jgi:hypothetical protein
VATLKRVLVVIAIAAAIVTPVTLTAAPANATGCDNTWVGGGSDSWANSADWTSGVPTSSQNVCIPYVSSHNPAIFAGTIAHALSVTESQPATLSILNGSLQVNAPSTFYYLNIEGSGASLIANGAVTVNAYMYFYGGSTVTGTGSFTTNGSFSLTQSGTINMGVNWNINGAVQMDGPAINATGKTITVGGTGSIDSRLATVGTAVTAGSIVFNSTAASHFSNVNVNAPVTVGQGTAYFGNDTLSSLSQTAGTVGLYDPADNAVGTLTITGNYALAGNLNFNTKGAGTAGTDYDQLVVNGNLTGTGNANTVKVAPLSPYTGATSDSFSFISGSNITATFGGPDWSGATPYGISASTTQNSYSTTLSAPPNGTINGTVVVDSNGNGTRDASDNTGVAGVTVFADANSNNMLDNGEVSTTSNGSGVYSLSVPPGTYNVRAVALTGYTTTLQPTGSVTVTSSATTNNQDLGLFADNTFSGTVFNDTDGNGTQGSGEAGIAGVTVFDDVNNNGSLENGEPSTTTDANGNYTIGSETMARNPHHLLAVAPAGSTATNTVSAITVSTSGATVTNNFGFQLPPPTTTTMPPTTTTTTPAPTTPTTVTPTPTDPESQGTGYWLIGQNGSVYPYGAASDLGSPASLPSLNAPIISISANPTGGGYWAVGGDGGVFAYGTAQFYGSAASLHLNAPVANIAPTPDGNGYWLVAKDGGVFTYGDAKFFGSAVGLSKRDVVGIAPTPDGNGYWLVAKDGGVFAFGDAKFLGSMGGHALHGPVVGIAASNSGNGYYLAASDGGVFTFGDAVFHGSAGGTKLAKPIVSMHTKADGSGYVLVASDGGVFTFGTDPFLGAPTATITAPLVQ